VSEKEKDRKCGSCDAM